MLQVPYVIVKSVFLLSLDKLYPISHENIALGMSKSGAGEFVTYVCLFVLTHK